MSQQSKYRYSWIAATIVSVTSLILVYNLVPDNYREITTIPEEMKGEFSFEIIELDNDLREKRTIRPVNQAVKNIDAWVSSVGAAVALDDIDMNGYSDDICLVDTRTDSVEIRKLPISSQSHYDSFFIEKRTSNIIAPMGCAAGDFNEDGYTDLLIYYWGTSPSIYLRNPLIQNISKAAFIKTSLVSPNEVWYTNAFTQADFNGDGHLDFFFGNYEREDSYILDDTKYKDGILHHSKSMAFNGGLNKLFVGIKEQKLTYVDKSELMNIDWMNGWTLAVGTADLNGDLLPELYIANDFGPDRLLLNTSKNSTVSFLQLEGEFDWTIPRSHQLGKDSFKGMGIDFADLNSDGILDFYVSNLAQRFALRESHLAFLSNGNQEKLLQGVAPYTNKSEELGIGLSDWAWDAKFADFNNDGTYEISQATGFVNGNVDRWAELHELAFGNDELIPYGKIWPRFSQGDDLSGHVRNAFFVLGRKGKYLNIAEALALSPQPLMTRGIAIGDPDGDGDQDMVMANQWQPSTFFVNNSLNSNSQLSLNIRKIRNKEIHSPSIVKGSIDVTGTSPLIGAVVRLPEMNRIAIVDGGNGHSGDNSKQVHFGLGKIDLNALIEVEISWIDLHGKQLKKEMRLKPGSYTIFVS